MLKELFFLFFKLGFTAFGGPIAHIGMIEREVIESRKLIPKDIFLNFISTVNLIPGPNSTQIVFLCGFYLKGILGMMVSGFAFIFPAVLITLFLAIIYHSADLIPILTPLFKYLNYGVFPIILFSLSKFIKLSSKNIFFYVYFNNFLFF